MYYESNELAHYGIKGMKWGHRRFRTESGDLTAAGKARYGADGGRKVTVRKAGINARKAASAAKKESIANDRARGGVSVRKAGINARKAAAEASKRSLAKDKEHNRKLREQEKNDPEAQARKETAKKIAKGAAIVAGTAIAAYGVTKLVKNRNAKLQMDKGKEAAEKYWQSRQVGIKLSTKDGVHTITDRDGVVRAVDYGDVSDFIKKYDERTLNKALSIRDEYANIGKNATTREAFKNVAADTAKRVEGVTSRVGAAAKNAASRAGSATKQAAADAYGRAAITEHKVRAAAKNAPTAAKSAAKSAANTANRAAKSAVNNAKDAVNDVRNSIKLDRGQAVSESPIARAMEEEYIRRRRR